MIEEVSTEEISASVSHGEPHAENEWFYSNVVDLRDLNLVYSHLDPFALSGQKCHGLTSKELESERRS